MDQVTSADRMSAVDEITNPTPDTAVAPSSGTWILETEDLPAVATRGSAEKNNGTNTRAE
jgi:hypothetical protein